MTSARTALLLLLLAAPGLAAASEGAPRVVERLGTLEYRYAFSLPPARGRFQPRLAIEYSSKTTTDAGIGIGWTLTSARLERRAVGASTRVFYVRDGAGKILASSAARDGTGFSAPDVEDGYLVFRQVDAGTWEAFDAEGSRYLFTTQGGVASVWHLSRVTDLDGNRTEFGYAADARLASITYNFYDSAAPGSTAAVPAAATTFASRVELEWTAPYASALANVRVKNQGLSGLVTVRRWALGYTTSTTGARVVQTITEIGKEAGLALPATSFEYASPAAPSQPSAITEPLGRRFAFTYAPSTSFGDMAVDARYLVTSVVTTGPGLAAETTTYWYASPVTSTRWYDEMYDYRGFVRSWAQSTSDQIVRSAWWEVYSSAFLGRPAKVEWGTATSPGTTTVPPAYAAFRSSTFEHTSRTRSGTCVGPALGADGVYFASSIATTGFPVTTFTSRERKAVQVDGVQLANEVTIACAGVDAYGHVTSARIDPDVLRAQDEHLRKATYVVATNPATACKDCLDTASATDVAGTVLSFSRREHDATWRVSRLWMKPGLRAGSTAPEPPEQLVTSWSYDGNGNLASRTEGGVTTSWVYDRVQLRPERVQSSDGSKTLATDTAHDDYGNETLITGPYLVGSAAPRRLRGILHDDVGRPRAVSRRAIAGATIQDALLAFEYFDRSATIPASVRVHQFSVPATYTDPAIPQRADVRQRTLYVDGAGRVIQARERLGGTLAADPASRITQNLSGYRVSAVAIYDAAGRLAAALDPFHSSGASYVDYRTAPVDNLHAGDPGGLSSALHVTLRGFDERGRETCNVYRVMPSRSAIPALGACVSSFREDASYARAVTTSYRGVTVNGVAYVGVKEIPAENNAGMTPEGRAPNGPESFFDASGRLQGATDVDGNRVSYLYDLLGRATTMVRDVADGSRPSIATTISYDMMGRPYRRADPNVGTRDFWYDDAGRLWRIELPRHKVLQEPGAGDLWARDEIRVGFDVGRAATVDLCTASAVPSGGTHVVQTSCVRESTLGYDTPYASDPVYENVAGRLASATNGLSTIAYSYSPEGVPVRRDQWISGLSGKFTTSETTLLDGQPTRADFASPYGSFSYDLSYDSMRRPVKLEAGAATYWQAISSLTTGAFDAVGRVASVDVDASRVHSTWTYTPYGGLEASARVSTATLDLFHVTGETYRGSKLVSYRDELGSTTYQYWYSDTGSLKTAKATPDGASTLARNALVCLSFNVTKKYGPGPSFGNVERVRDQAMTPARDERYAYGGTGLEGATPPGPDATTAVTTATASNPLLYDYLGRVQSKALGMESFEFDLLNRLTRITRTSGANEVIRYDPTGNILGRLVGSTVTYYLGQQATITATTLPGCSAPGCAVDPSTVRSDVHVLVGSRRVASVRVTAGALGRVVYLHRDRLGSVVTTSLGGGVAGAHYRYGEHGAIAVALGDAGDAASELGFTGALRLSGGLLLLGSRVYDPSLRQFLQPDALDPMTYTYAGGDPVNHVDPSGLFPVSVDTVERTTVASSGHVFGTQLLGPLPAGGMRSQTVVDEEIPVHQDGGNGGGAPEPRVDEEIIVDGPRPGEGGRPPRPDTIPTPPRHPDFGPGPSGIPGGGEPGGGRGGGGVVRAATAGPSSTTTTGGYSDLNFTIGAGIGATGGIIYSDTGEWYFYFGGGLIIGPGVTVTRSTSSVTPGFTVAFSASTVIAYQRGYTRSGGWYDEYGAGGTGASVTGFWVW